MRVCSMCHNPIRASDKYQNTPDHTKRHLNCVYPEMYQPSKAAPGVRKLMLQSLAHRKIRTEAELNLVLAETKALLQASSESQQALLNLRKQNGR
jgi:hypothetical protein